MNLKNNKGYVGVDISIAVIILLILVPVIMGIVYNVNASRNATKVKSGATNIAVNAMEAAKGIDSSILTANSIISSLSSDIYNGQIESTTLEEDEAFSDDEISGTYTTYSYVAVNTSEAGYKLKILVKDYKNQNPEAIEGVVKTVKATVIYKVGNKKGSIDLSTVVK